MVDIVETTECVA